MTNREWLSTLPDVEFALFVLYNLPDIGKQYSDSLGGIIDWLGKVHIE